MIVDSSVSSVAISASAIDSKASVSGTGTVNLQNGNNDITIAVKAENGHVRNYIIHVVRQDNGPTSVSYTHLDVYKRQIYVCLGLSFLITAILSVALYLGCLLYTSRCV